MRSVPVGSGGIALGSKRARYPRGSSAWARCGARAERGEAEADFRSHASLQRVASHGRKLDTFLVPEPGPEADEAGKCRCGVDEGRKCYFERLSNQIQVERQTAFIITHTESLLSPCQHHGHSTSIL